MRVDGAVELRRVDGRSGVVTEIGERPVESGGIHTEDRGDILLGCWCADINPHCISESKLAAVWRTESGQENAFGEKLCYLNHGENNGSRKK